MKIWINDDDADADDDVADDVSCMGFCVQSANILLQRLF